jgi:hypothetical protein
MAESVNNQPTSLQYRLLKKQIDALVPARLRRLNNVALLQGLRRKPKLPTPAP